LFLVLEKNAVVRVVETISLPAVSKDNELILLMNRFALSADEIADIYNARWAIELFFKWMKQHLSIKKFYGHSEQAVHNQEYRNDCLLFECPCSNTYKKSSNLFTNKSLSKGFPLEAST